MDIKLLTEQIDCFAKDRDWDQFHTVKNLAMALTVEAAELQEIFQWMKENESNCAHLNPELKEKISDEIADVFVYLLRISEKNKIDIE